MRPLFPVVEDMLREAEASFGEAPHKLSAAHMRWLEHVNDLEGERARTLYVVDGSTTFESYPELAPNVAASSAKSYARLKATRDGMWPFWFPVAREALRHHADAARVRVVQPDGHYRPAAGEVVLVRRKRRNDRQLYVDTYCAVATCNHDFPLLTHLANIVAVRGR